MFSDQVYSNEVVQKNDMCTKGEQILFCRANRKPVQILFENMAIEMIKKFGPNRNGIHQNRCM